MDKKHWRGKYLSGKVADEYYNLYYQKVLEQPSTATAQTSYYQQVASGQTPKRYKGGDAAKAKHGGNRIFDAYFKPLGAK